MAVVHDGGFLQMTGRPSSFTQETVDTICERISNGESLRSICEEDGMPDKSTVCRWLAQHDAFRDQYAYARDMQADALFDEILDIADDATNDWMKRKQGDDYVEVPNQEHIQRSRLRIDSRKWMAGKLQPKKYGERVELNHSGAISNLTDESIDARIAQLLGTTGTDGASGGAGEAEEAT